MAKLKLRPRPIKWENRYADSCLEKETMKCSAYPLGCAAIRSMYGATRTDLPGCVKPQTIARPLAAFIACEAPAGLGLIAGVGQSCSLPGAAIMTDKPKKLSDTARALLTLAATRDNRLIRPPQLPTATARQVVRSLLNARLAEEVPAPIEDAA